MKEHLSEKHGFLFRFGMFALQAKLYLTFTMGCTL